MDLVRTNRSALLIAAVFFAALAVPFGGVAVANHPANSCLDVEPETAEGAVGDTYTITATLRTLVNGACTGAELQPTTDITVNAEITGPNDTDNGNTPNTPDLTCTITAKKTNCTVKYDAGTAGTDTILGYLDHDQDDTLDSGEPTDEVTRTTTQTGPPPPPAGPTCPGFETDQRNQIVGTDNSEVLQGTAGDDIICALGGDDVVYGLGGNDLILGGLGHDVLKGGDGNDVLKGGGGSDALYGEAGDDILRGGAGNDYLSGGPGKDVLRGGAGRDFLDGGPDADRCRGGAGRDAQRSC